MKEKKKELSAYGKEMVDNLRKSLLKNEAFVQAIEALDAEDLNDITQEAVKLLSRWVHLIDHRRRTTKRYTNLKQIPLGVQRYHTLILHEVAQQTRASLDKLRGLLIRFELTGVNGYLSNFFIDHMLAPNKTRYGTHILKTTFIHEDRNVVHEILTSQGLSGDDIKHVDETLDSIPEEVYVNVVQSQQPWPGGPSGTAVVIPGISINFPKGFNNWFENAFGDVEDFLKGAVDMEWTHGIAGAYDMPVFPTKSTGFRMGISGAEVWFGVALGFMIAGCILTAAGEEELGGAIGGFGCVMVVFQAVGGVVGGDFTDP
jgi:hypothetical protein